MSRPLSAFGLAISTAIDLPGRWTPATPHDLPLTVTTETGAEIERRWSGPARLGWRGVSDGEPFVTTVGTAGDLHITHGALTAWLAPDGTHLCLDGDVTSVPVLRSLLDSVLFTVALWRGRDALHAGAVATDAGVVAVVGASGAGKSSLVSALRRAGAGFFADDVLVLGAEGVHPGPPVLTVPAGATVPGKRLATVGDEHWVAVEDPRPGPAPLVAIVALETAARPTWATVLDGLLRFPDDEAAAARRAATALRLADEVPVLSVAPRSATPQVLAQRVNDWTAGYLRP